MTGARRRALIVVGILTVGVAGLGLALTTRPRPHSTAAPSEKVPLQLLTSLPIVFGEDFDVKKAGSPALTALSKSFTVSPVSTTSSKELRNSLLLMAQPPAQTPENLVALDAWVRRGGRVLLLADPLLEWPSKRPLGDPLRPPAMFTDTGLLAHWGLRLDAPDTRGGAERRLAGYTIIALSPGALYGRCIISSDRLVAECRIGKGWAAVVADADFLNVQDLGPDAKDNFEAVTSELASLKNR